MNHCLAQVFSVGLPQRLPKRDFMGCPVVFQNQWMVHGDICGALFKVAYRVAPRGHHIAKQLVGFRYRTGGAIDEPRLDSAPGLHKARAIAWRERADVESLDSFGTLFEPGFRVPPAPFFHRASVFLATEPSAQFFSPALSKK